MGLSFISTAPYLLYLTLILKTVKPSHGRLQAYFTYMRNFYSCTRKLDQYLVHLGKNSIPIYLHRNIIATKEV